MAKVKKVKQKTKKAAAKRFKKTGTGKIMRTTAGRGHLLGHKTTKRKRNLRGSRLVADGDVKRIATLLPK